MADLASAPQKKPKSVKPAHSQGPLPAPLPPPPLESVAVPLARLDLAQVRASYTSDPHSDKYVSVAFLAPTPVPPVKKCKCCKGDRAGKCGVGHRCSGRCLREQARAPAAPGRYIHPTPSSHTIIMVTRPLPHPPAPDLPHTLRVWVFLCVCIDMRPCTCARST